MLSTDEEAVAADLRESGVRGVVVHRDLTQALDRDNTDLPPIVLPECWHR